MQSNAIVSLYKERFEKSSNDVNFTDNYWKKKGMKWDAGKDKHEVFVFVPQKTRENPSPLSAEVRSVIDGMRLFF